MGDHAAIAPAAVEAPVVKAAKKTKGKGKESSSDSPLFKDMVMDAIITQKERSGSSLSAIKNHVSSKYKVDVAKKAGILNRALKKMCDEGVLVAGAPPGRKGAGCFKVSQEEKSRLADAAKAAAKKISAKKSALSAKKPIAKSNKAAAVGAKKKVAPKSIKVNSKKATKM